MYEWKRMDERIQERKKEWKKEIYKDKRMGEKNQKKILKKG